MSKANQPFPSNELLSDASLDYVAGGRARAFARSLRNSDGSGGTGGDAPELPPLFPPSTGPTVPVPEPKPSPDGDPKGRRR
jgi:hypothetical protein